MKWANIYQVIERLRTAEKALKWIFLEIIWYISDISVMNFAYFILVENIYICCKFKFHNFETVPFIVDTAIWCWTLLHTEIFSVYLYRKRQNIFSCINFNCFRFHCCMKISFSVMLKIGTVIFNLFLLTRKEIAHRIKQIRSDRFIWKLNRTYS